MGPERKNLAQRKTIAPGEVPFGFKLYKGPVHAKAFEKIDL
jgi:hypothetical protein